jgi:hypothetical protein
MAQVGGVHPLAALYRWAAWARPQPRLPPLGNRIEARHECRRLPERVELIDLMIVPPYPPGRTGRLRESLTGLTESTQLLPNKTTQSQC